MQRIIFVLMVIAIGVLLLSCSDEMQSPMTTSEPDPTIALTDEAFNTKRGWSDKMTTGSYEVVLENLTSATGPGASQPFSPPVLVTHKSRVSLFRVHHYASDELRQIAEDAVNGPMVEKLEDSQKVLAVAQGTGVIFPGSSASFTIDARRGYHKFSLVSMLVNTNDAFTGISGANLPLKGEKVYYLYAYDAGTEQNTELTDHIPGPCCGNPLVRVPTRERISIHQGILGIGNLDPAVYNWDKKVAKLTIRRIN